MGRARFEFTPERIAKIKDLADGGCTQDEIATAIGCSYETLRVEKNKPNSAISAILKAGHENLAVYIKSKFMELLAAKNPAAVIFGLKAICGYHDRAEVHVVGDKDRPIEIRVTTEKLKRIEEKATAVIDV